MDNLHLIVGLGNPGTEYELTRHNAGFLAVEELGRHWQAVWKMENRFKARVGKCEWQGKKFLLAEPQTYMNCSGESVGPLVQFYRLPLRQVVVVVDDADLPLGQIRLRPGGSSGGHHGLDSVEKYLGTRDYARLRIGIGRSVPGVREIHGHVLGRFAPDEWDLFQMVLKRTSAQLESWASEGLERAMNQFNGAVKGPTTKETK
ncbi:MAG: aminoacyl-tRNA hydrolase [Verrucomicrobiota bacterium]|nr:aminoacyl-tRNA hydrolase [Verrucomicrobiota bacterium]